MMLRLARSRTGATAMEFALLAPVFIAAVFGIIETGRMMWMSQALSEAAFSTVRCKSIDKQRCDTAAKQADYALARAASSGIPLRPADVRIRTGVTCRGQAGSSEVLLTKAFNSPVPGLLPLPATVEGRACLPTL